MRFPRAKADEANGNIAPLLDVVLLLLIFFMVTTSFADRQIPLDLPSAESGSSSNAESVMVTVDAKGSYSVDSQVVSESELIVLLEELVLQERNLEIRADAAARHGHVVRLLDLAKQLGISRLGIVVDQAD